MAHGVAIKALDQSHANAVARVMRTSFDATYPDFDKLHSFEGDCRFVANTLMERTKVFGALSSDQLAGFIAFDDDEIDQLYLLAEWQRQGIGSALLQKAMAHSDHLTLWTFAVNRSARAFYAKHGFKEIAQTADDNEQGEPDVQLAWHRA